MQEESYLMKINQNPPQQSHVIYGDYDRKKSYTIMYDNSFVYLHFSITALIHKIYTKVYQQ